MRHQLWRVRTPPGNQREAGGDDVLQATRYSMLAVERIRSLESGYRPTWMPHGQYLGTRCWVPPPKGLVGRYPWWGRSGVDADGDGFDARCCEGTHCAPGHAWHIPLPTTRPLSDPFPMPDMTSPAQQNEGGGDRAIEDTRAKPQTHSRTRPHQEM